MKNLSRLSAATMGAVSVAYASIALMTLVHGQLTPDELLWSGLSAFGLTFIVLLVLKTFSPTQS